MRENDYFKKIDTYREEMIADLQQLIRKESTPQIPEEGAPFGRGVAEAYAFMMKLAEREGFSVFDAVTEAISTSVLRRKTESWGFCVISMW